jgi:hypothetical protein
MKFERGVTPGFIADGFRLQASAHGCALTYRVHEWLRLTHGAEDPMKHTHKNHEIEVSTRDNGDFIEASAKFKPMTGYIGTFSIWGKFPSLEAAEQTVLEEAKRIIDNRSK